MTLYVRKWAHERRPDATFDPAVAVEWRKDARIMSETSVHEFIERTPARDHAEAMLDSLHEVLRILDGEPQYHHQGMGCGLEDRCITDRYQAMSYGWDEAMERVYSEHVNPAVEIASAAITAASAQQTPGEATHRIERIGGDQVAVELRIVSHSICANEFGIYHSALMSDGTLFEGYAGHWTQLPPVPQPTPPEPAQDSELVRDLKALRHAGDDA